jgi:hypothetical protein
MPPELAPIAAALAARTAPVRVWWRDDDTGPAEPKLDRLLAIAGDDDVPLALAVVPALLEPGTAAKLMDHPGITVAQHGWSHADHSRPGERKVELGGSMDHRRLLADLACGLDLLRSRLGRRLAPVIVPPWNRFDHRLEPGLVNLGFRAVSALGAQDRGHGLLPRIDVHLDAMAWRPTPRWLGLGALAHHFARLLVGGAATVGVMTHHRVMRDEDFRELRRLLAFLAACRGVRLVGLQDLLEPGDAHAAA